MASILNVQHLRKTFKKADGTAYTAVNDISFSLNRGEIFSFLGPNGAGKSTTINMMTTQLTPTAGEIQIDGHSIVTDPIAARQKIGVVAQHNNLDRGLTAYENLIYHGLYFKMTPADAKERANQLLHDFGLYDWRNDYVRSFSGGMAQRLKIARAIMHRPELLFLDEPTTGLDPGYRDILWQHVLALRDHYQTTVFLTTHYMAEPERFSDRIAIYHQGEIKAIGTLAELKQLVPAQQRITVVLKKLPATFVQSLQADPALKSIQQQGDQQLMIYADAGQDSLAHVLECIEQSQLELLNIQSNSTTLDDIFIYLTSDQTTQGAD